MTESKKNVLTCYYRPKPGGFCKRLFRAIDALLVRGHTVHYLAVVPFPIDHPNCHFHKFPWPENYTSGYLFWAFFHLFAPLQLFIIGFSKRINCLFAFGGHNYAMFLQPLRVLKQIPLTLFLRGDTIEKHRANKRSHSLIYLENFLEGLGIVGTSVYGVSETLTKKIVDRHIFLKPYQVGVLRNDIVKYRTRSYSTGKALLPLRLACVGLLEPGKNQRFLLEVMKEVKANQAQLCLYGIGFDLEILTEKVKTDKLTEQVHFKGWVISEKIWPEVDLLLMPSLHEGAPNAVLEALGNGIAVLASNIPEHTEILPKKYLLPLDDYSKWVETIQQISHDPKIQLQKITCAQEEIAEKLTFDWDQEVVKCIV